MNERRKLHLPSSDEIGRWLDAMDDARARTLALIAGLSDTDLDRGSPNSIGSVLYHLAAIEADWLFDDIRGEPDAMPMELFPHVVREEGGSLTSVTGSSVVEHLERLTTIRRAFREHVETLDEPAFHSLNSRAAFDVSPAYVIHHLLQHEAEHRAEIGRTLNG